MRHQRQVKTAELLPAIWITCGFLLLFPAGNYLKLISLFASTSQKFFLKLKIEIPQEGNVTPIFPHPHITTQWCSALWNTAHFPLGILSLTSLLLPKSERETGLDHVALAHKQVQVQNSSFGFYCMCVTFVPSRSQKLLEKPSQVRKKLGTRMYTHLGVPGFNSGSGSGSWCLKALGDNGDDPSCRVPISQLRPGLHSQILVSTPLHPFWESGEWTKGWELLVSKYVSVPKEKQYKPLQQQCYKLLGIGQTYLNCFRSGKVCKIRFKYHKLTIGNNLSFLFIKLRMYIIQQCYDFIIKECTLKLYL